MANNEYEAIYGQALQDNVMKGNTVIVINGHRIDKTNADKIPVGDFAVTKEISENMAKSMVDGAAQDKKGTKYLNVELCNITSELANYYDNRVAFEQGKIDEQGFHIKQKQIAYAFNKSPVSDKIGMDVIPDLIKQIDKGALEKVENIPLEKRKGIHPPDESKMYKKEFVNAFDGKYTRIVDRIDAKKLANRDNKAERYKEVAHDGKVQKYAEGAYKSKLESEKEIIKMGYTEGVARSATIVGRKDPMLQKKVFTDTGVSMADVKKYAKPETQKELLQQIDQQQKLTQQQTQTQGRNR